MQIQNHIIYFLFIIYFFNNFNCVCSFNNMHFQNLLKLLKFFNLIKFPKNLQWWSNSIFYKLITLTFRNLKVSRKLLISFWWQNFLRFQVLSKMLKTLELPNFDIFFFCNYYWNYCNVFKFWIVVFNDRNLLKFN